MSDNDRDFLRRWSRRKLASRSEAKTAGPEANPGNQIGKFADFDFGSLVFDSDYRRFMIGDVPDQIRNRAMRRLWLSSDLISRPDELDDFLEDFSEEARGLTPELARSAYRVGRGFVSNCHGADSKKSDAAEVPGDQDSRAPQAEAEALPQDTETLPPEQDKETVPPVNVRNDGACATEVEASSSRPKRGKG